MYSFAEVDVAGRAEKWDSANFFQKKMKKRWFFRKKICIIVL